MSLQRLIPGVLLAIVHSACAALTPFDLRCDGMSGCPAVGASPRLSWRVESSLRGQSQSAWQVLVASSTELVAEGRGDLWDSGKKLATRSPIVAYAGRALAPGQTCYWKVRCWDSQDQPSVWSEPAVFAVAPLEPAAWQGARWIDDGRPIPSTDEAHYQSDPAPLLRHEFELAKPVVRARLHVAGLGWCTPSLNGSRVGDHALAPPWTAFDRRILFSTHDVTEQLALGPNCLGLALGNGWFNPLPLRMWGHRNIRDSLATGRPRAIACLVADHPDGTSTTVVTGPGWQTTGGPTLKNNVYLGEVRDARRELPGWDQAGFDASDWTEARVTDDPLEPLRPLAMPPVRAGKPIPAKAVTSPAPGVHIVDFGQNFTGVPEINVRAPAGTQVTLRYGEILHPDGTLNPLTSVCGQIKGTREGPDGREISVGGPGAPAVACQQDVFITGSDDPEVYRPEFTFHGFRYLEVTGLPKPPLAADCSGIPLYTDLDSVGTFSCSNERLNRIQEMCLRTFLANAVSVQSDCPHRERFAYGGDIVATSDAFLMNFDMAGFYAKTVRDWADAARPDGSFTDTAPFVGINYCGVGWAMVHPLLLEQLHRHYGIRDILEEQVPVAMRWLETEAAGREDGLVARGLGDHEALTRAGGSVLTTPMFVDAARRVARLARLIGREADAARYEAMANESATAWADAFLEAETGKVGGGSQSEQTFALGFRTAPPDSRPLIFQQLVDELATPEGPSLTTGIFGTRFLLEELSRAGRSDVAYALADRSIFPSWGWMLENDATTLWEHWAGSDNTFSHSHPMFGSVSAWFFRWLGGIQPAPDAIGFDRIVIRPQVVPGLEWVKCSHRSIRGLIESNWTASPTQLQFEIVVPPDTSALVILPARPGDAISEGGRSLTEVEDIEVLAPGPVSHRLRIGSGRYEFQIIRMPPVTAATSVNPTPGPDDTPRNVCKPLKVFILAGQSNMQGHAHVSTFDAIGLDPKTAPILDEMRHTDGTPRVCEHVWISSIGCAPEEQVGRLTAGFGASAREPKIGPEFTFGIYMQKLLDESILIIKTAWGGKSLHTDFRPPSAGPYQFNEAQLEALESQGKDIEALKADKAKASGHYYRLMTEHVTKVLADIQRVYPDYDPKQGYEVAGFVWFQGWNDMVDRGVYPDRDKPGGYDLYSELLAQFIRDIRQDLSAPEMPFVIGVMGVGGPTDEYPPEQQRYQGVHQNFRNAMAAPAARPEFNRTVIAVQTAEYWDMQVVALRAREDKIKPRVEEINKEMSEGRLSREEGSTELERLYAETFTESELVILRESTSNADYHYMGSAKIMAQIGKAFAEAMAETRESLVAEEGQLSTLRSQGP
jgi:alpha-L-rhamnosidase